jgi:hypothetical protein
MFDTRQFLKWLSALGTGLAAVILAFVGTQLTAFDPSTVASDPLVAGAVGLVVALVARVVSWLTSKIPV